LKNQKQKKQNQRKIESTKFAEVLGKGTDGWKKYTGRKLFRFMCFCIQTKNTEMVHNIQQLVHSRLKSQGLIYNPILGWVMPNETDSDVSGVKQLFDGNWVISNHRRFNIYNQAKTANTYSGLAKERADQENEGYINSILKDDKIPF